MKSSQTPDNNFYVFSQDESRGPYTWNDIELELESGVLTDSDLVWTSLSKKWIKIKDYGEYTSDLEEIQKQIEKNQQSPSLFPHSEDKSHWKLDPFLDDKKKTPLSGIEKLVRRYRIRTRWPRYALLLVLSVLGIFFVVGEYHNYTSEQHTSFLNQALKKQVTIEERRELLSARLERLSKGPSLALAIAQSENRIPSFFIASNLPDGSLFDIHVQGRKGTLVGQITVSKTATVKILDGMAQSAPFESALGKALPKGEYEVTVVDSSYQPSEAAGILSQLQPIPSIALPNRNKPVYVLTRKIYFLGGVKDESYDFELRRFHEQVRSKSFQELIELEQWTSTLEDQLISSMNQFQSRIGASSSQANLTRWEKFSDSWVTFSAKLQKEFNQWSEAWIQKTVINQSLYRDIKRSAELITQTHEYQTQSLIDPSDENAMVLAADTASTAQSLIYAIKSKIQRVRTEPPSATGLLHIPE